MSHQNHHAKKHHAKASSAHGESLFNQYPTVFEHHSTGTAHINARFPVIGFAKENEVDQSLYVENGVGVAYVRDTEFPLEPGDVLSIPRKTPYWIEGEELKLVVVSSPPWFLEQHEVVETIE